MVEILGAQGMLIHNFMSPLANKRMDAYGGELKERVKFAVEIIRKVKEKTASSFPVIFRMVASDLVDGGLNLENAKVMAPILVDAGADALHVTAGAGFEVEYLMTPPADAGKVCIVDSVAAIKEVVDIPVIAVQRITDPLEAEEILKDGKADIICMGRALLADPDLPRKAAEGRLKDIRHCIGCCQCIDMLYHDKRLACLQNPEVGREKEYEITEVVKYIARELSRLNVRVELNRTVTPALIEESKPDVAIVATGAIPIIPEIREIDRENVITAHDVLSGEAGVGDRVVVLGGGLVGCETAHYLAERGKKVTIVEMLEELATDVGVCRKPFLFHGLSEGGVEILTSTRVKAISDGGLIAETQSNERNIGVFDTIVLALGARSVKELTEQLNRKVREVYVIGDAAEPRKAIDAIAEGSLIGREI